MRIRIAYSHEAMLARRSNRRPPTPQQDLRNRARVARTCLLWAPAIDVARVWLVSAVERAALAATVDELVDLEQVLFVATE